MIGRVLRLTAFLAGVLVPIAASADYDCAAVPSAELPADKGAECSNWAERQKDRLEATSYAQVAEDADTEFERIPETIAVLDKLIVRLGAAMQEQAVPDFDRFSETVWDLRQEFRTELASKFIEPERNLWLLIEQLGVVIENKHARFSDSEVRDAAGKLVKAGRLLKEYTQKMQILFAEYS